ncbi:MAG: DNA-processing protein DprA [Nitrosopumilus sp. H8]|nr:MAG: DNA-processing protein DprA [Nitrosopumilus sp. H8]
MAFLSASMGDLLGRQLDGMEEENSPGTVYYAGPMSVPLPRPRISVVGSRDASAGGLLRAGEIAEVLRRNGIIVVSGLARGIDSAAHRASMGGGTIAVIGTPLDRAYPRENHSLQDEIARDHLVISQYPEGHKTVPWDFVLRDLTMALISEASVIVEAKDGSGSLHHGWEALRLGRPLFIPKTVAENPALEWPKKMTRHGAVEFGEPEDILDCLRDPGTG